MRGLNGYKLTDKEKDTLIDVVKKTHNKIDIGKIKTNTNTNHLETFGYMRNLSLHV